MDVYTFCLLLGLAGLVVMALLGLSHGGDTGHGHADHGGQDGVHGGEHLQHAHHDHASHDHSHDQGHEHNTHNLRSSLPTFLSPRVLFSVLFGLGATGLLARPATTEPLTALLAVGGGVGFERLLVRPMWNFIFGFASKPARTLDSSVLEEAHAVTNFDAAGQGLIAFNLDGQVVQVLGTLRPEERAAGVRVRSGDRLYVVAVDTRRNSCTVSTPQSKQTSSPELSAENRGLN